MPWKSQQIGTIALFWVQVDFRFWFRHISATDPLALASVGVEPMIQAYWFSTFDASDDQWWISRSWALLANHEWLVVDCLLLVLAIAPNHIRGGHPDLGCSSNDKSPSRNLLNRFPSLNPVHSLRNPEKIFQDLVLNPNNSCFQDFSRWNKILFKISSNSCSDIFMSWECRILSGFTQDTIKNPLKIMKKNSTNILSRNW